MIIKEFNKLEEIQKYYDKETNTYIFKEDGKDIDLAIFNFDLRINAHIKAYDIKACDIKAFNIQANGINAWDITAWDINAGDIDAFNINAVDINADDIKATQIYARDINYHAVCVAYHDIICHSIEAKREYHKHFVLDGEIKVLENEELCEKDLEILEILKKHYNVNSLTKSLDSFISITINKTDKDFEKIKEWLDE